MLCDVHHNQCLQEFVGHVFIFLMGLQLYLIHINKISFVVTGINLLNSLSGVQTPHTVIIEPRSEKTGLRGFRSAPTQTWLYNHRRWLEA